MKIVRQLATWLLENDRITPDRYREVLLAIQGEVVKADEALLGKARRRQGENGSGEDEVETWWNLRGAGTRTRASRRNGGRKVSPGTKPVKVVDLDSLLPDMLLPPGAALDVFPLADLLVAVDKVRGNRRSSDWAGFTAAVASLYKIGAEELHDAFLAAMKVRGYELGEIIAAAEMGSSLFPDGFLSNISGESVAALRKHIAGEETEFSANRADWILRYPSFNVINEACLVRNRLRRIYRLWVKNLAEWDASGATRHGNPGICLVFGKIFVAVPAVVWWRLQDPSSPCLGSVRGLIAFPAPKGSCFLNVSVDGSPVVFYCHQCVDPFIPPCRFGQIYGEGLDGLSSPIQVIWPDVRIGKRVPVISRPDAPETMLWRPEDWSNAVLRRTKLSNGVPVEEMCPWRVLRLYPPYSGNGWIDMFLQRPDVVKEIPWGYINPMQIKFGRWHDLLCSHPEYAGHAPWKYFDNCILTRLFTDCPALAEHCNCNAIDGNYLRLALEKCPDCVGPCLRKMTDSSNWIKILSSHPEWGVHCPWQSFVSYDIGRILSVHPEFADNCELGKLNGFGWRILLCKQPQFADRCDWGTLDDSDRAAILRDQPQLSKFLAHNSP